MAQDKQVSIETYDNLSCPECPVCYCFFCEPLTLDCKHTFCRACLLEVTYLAPDGRSCPMCRAPISIRSPIDHSVDAAMEEAVVTSVGSDVYVARQAKDGLRVREVSLRADECHPVFSLGSGVRVGQRVGLHFFESRYKVLIRRAWEGNQLFVYAPGGRLCPGTRAVIVRIHQATFTPDGCADIVGLAVEEVRLGDVWVSEGTDGLVYTRVTKGAATHTGATSIATPTPPRALSPPRRTCMFPFFWR